MAETSPRTCLQKLGEPHIGMFLAWAILRGLQGSLHEGDSPESLRAVRERRMTGRDFLLTECDEKFVEEDLNDEGNAFAEGYYMKQGAEGYLADYEEALGEAHLPSLYHIENTWENFDRLVPILDRRLEEWRAARRP